MNLQGKTILITGASRGIGAATVRHCVEAGARVIAHASGPGEAARTVAEHLEDPAGHFLFEDLSAEGAGARLFSEALSVAGRIDGLVNNAGIYEATPLAGVADEAQEAWSTGWQKTWAVNVQAPADLCRAAISHFRDQSAGDAPGGAIVNICSRAGHRGDGPDHAGYAASKGALLAMTKTWARALSGENIHLYSIAPGWVETRMAPADIAARERAVAEIPLGRVAAPEEVAAMIAFLLSGACPSAVGATIDINGASYVR